jgi:lipoic acid synthetase
MLVELHRKPEWLKVRAPGGERFAAIKERVRRLHLNTVCQEARCPNLGECWGGGTATFMLLGDVCTRGCRFCAVTSAREGRPLDPEEPAHVARAVGEMGLTHVVLTSVNRDDLPDQGASHFAQCVRAIKRLDSRVIVEVLTPDWQGDESCARVIALSGAEILAHNVEVVRRLQRTLRDARCDYDTSLALLRAYRRLAPERYTKSSIMVGAGEDGGEVLETLSDLREAGVSLVTIGQYLRPSPKHAPVVRYVHPDEFAAWEREAQAMGFLYAASGPLVRSSYRAGELFVASLPRRGGSAEGGVNA